MALHRGVRLAAGLALLSCALGLSTGRSVALAADLADIHGVVHDAEHRPLGGARVELRAAHSGWVQHMRTGAQGEFSFPSVPLGDYRLEVTRAGYAPAAIELTVLAGASPALHLQLAPAGSLETVTVNAKAAQPVPLNETFTPTTLVSRSDIALTPGADQTNSLAMITDFVPGAYLVHDQLHVRGGHQTSWEIDGVEIPNTNIGSNLGPQIDPKDIDYLEIERGSYSADEGDRTYGVFNVVPRTGFERDDEAQLTAGAGNFAQADAALSVGSHTERFAYYASVEGNRSDLGLMTPVPQVLHDAEDGYGLFSSLIDNLGPDDQLRLIVQARRDDYQIPNLPGQLADDTQREADGFAILSWKHDLGPNAALKSSLLYHYNRADYDGGAGDDPLATTYQHSSTYFGGEESLRIRAGAHAIEAGLIGFGQVDDQLFRLQFNDGSSPAVRQRITPGGNLQALYLQDTYRVAHWLTLAGGVRQTHFAGEVTENATDPRLGLTVTLPNRWQLRGFYGKFYQAPPLVSLSGPLLQYASSSNLGFLPLHGERDTESQVGLAIPLAGWVLDLDHFRTSARNFFDHNPIGSSNIFIPLTLTGALIRGNELTLRSPRFADVLRVHLAYSNQTANGFGAVSGGLTDFSPPGGPYALDHDQRNTLSAGVEAELPGHAFASLDLYCGSGFANGNAPPSHLASYATLDAAVGRSFGNLRASLTVLNLTDRHLLIDNSLTFDGMHYNAPRQILAQVQYRMHY